MFLLWATQIAFDRCYFNMCVLCTYTYVKCTDLSVCLSVDKELLSFVLHFAFENDY